MKKIDPYTPHWEKLANQVARCFAPLIYPCGECGYPVASGYCCTFCHCSDPSAKSRKQRQEAAK